jgi:hypothetical protein
VSGTNKSGALKARDTVAGETPAKRATSETEGGAEAMVVGMGLGTDCDLIMKSFHCAIQRSESSFSLTA